MEREKLNKVLRERLNSEVLSPEEFKDRYEKNRDSLESAEIIPPEIGSDESGYILVKLPTAKSLSADSYNKLLSMLAETPEKQEEEFFKLRNSLIKMFQFRGISSEEELADEVIDRVASKIEANEKIENFKSYIFQVARFLSLEYLRKSKRYKEIPLSESDEPFYNEDAEQKDNDRYEKLQKALNMLSNEEKKIILNYYDTDTESLKSIRKKLAENLGLSPNTLMIKANRIRMKLENILGNS